MASFHNFTTIVCTVELCLGTFISNMLIHLIQNEIYPAIKQTGNLTEFTLILWMFLKILAKY